MDQKRLLFNIDEWLSRHGKNKFIYHHDFEALANS